MCEGVRIARVEGAFLVACYKGGRASMGLTNFNGLTKHVNVYEGRPTKAPIGFQSASAVFEDGRSSSSTKEGQSRLTCR